MPVYEKFFLREIRWRKVIFVRRKNVKKEINVEQNSFL